MFIPDKPLQPFNSFGISARAAWFARFTNTETVQELLAYIRNPTRQQAPRLILGGGSNILFTQNFPGYVLKNEIPGIERIREDDDHVYVQAGAGTDWHALVMYSLQQNLGGLENLALIPGKVGASPMQNIGAYGVELKDVFHELEAIHMQTGEQVRLGLQDCAFGYRESVFKNKYRNQFIITTVTYRLQKHPQLKLGYGAIRQELETMQAEPTIHTVAEAVMRIRRSKLPDPAQIGNAGSFFKNPEIDTRQFIELQSRFPGIAGYALPGNKTKLAAGWLIEHAGPEPDQSWKGYRQGDAGCHERQALVLVNHGHAPGTEILALSNRIRKSVEEKFAVRLETEVNIY